MRPNFEDTFEEKISYARHAVIFEAPYFASVVQGFVYVPLPGVRTMLCTPKMVLGYDPAWVKVATVKQLAADIVHEVHHLLRKHFERAGLLADPHLFNIAGDLTINPDLRDGGWELAGEDTVCPAIFPAHYKLPEGLSTEEYYAKLLQMKADGTLPRRKPSQGQNGKNQDGQGSASPAPAGQQAADTSQTGGPGAQGSQDDSGSGVCSGHCGGIAGGTDDPRLEAALDASEGRSEVEIRNIAKRAAADIKAHVERHGRGTLPSDIADIAKKLIEEPHVRWQSELAHVLYHASGRVQSGGDDFSMARPSKRSYARGIPRPGMIEHQPEVGIIRDSSGSMSNRQLTDCTREAYHIVQSLGIDEVWYADADAAVAMPWKRVSSQFFRNLKDVYGRGGTDFRPGIAAAQKLFPRPDILVYCTDGDGYAPEHPPQGMTVVWALMGDRCKAPAKWGKAIIVSDDPKHRNTKPLPPDEDNDDDV